MARNETLAVTQKWRELTANDVTHITLENRGHGDIEYIATPQDQTPVYDKLPQGLLLERGVGVINRRLSDMFPGAADAKRVFARSASGSDDQAYVFVSHA